MKVTPPPPDDRPRAKQSRAIEPRLLACVQHSATVVRAAAEVLCWTEVKGDRVTRVKAQLAATILDGQVAINALATTYGRYHSDTIARSMIEALGDLAHLCRSPNYLDRLELTSAYRSKDGITDFIAARIRDSDQESKALVSHARHLATEAKATIKRLKSKGVAPLAVEERIAASGLSSDVLSAYTDMCFDAHHDIRALQRRQKSSSEVVLGGADNFSAQVRPLVTGALVVCYATEMFPDFVPIPRPEADSRIARAFSAASAMMNLWTTANAQTMEILVEEATKSPGPAK